MIWEIERYFRLKRGSPAVAVGIYFHTTCSKHFFNAPLKIPDSWNAEFGLPEFFAYSQYTDSTLAKLSV